MVRSTKPGLVAAPAEPTTDAVAGDDELGARRTSLRNRVQSVDRAVAVLQRLLNAPSPLTTVEVAQQTGLNRTVVHRLLRTLQDAHMVSETASGRFRLGPGMLLYGNSFLERLPIRQQALPLLADLARSVIGDRPWVVALAVPIGVEMVIVERSWSPYVPLDAILGVGMSMPMVNSAHGRAVLSCMTDEEAAEILGDEFTDELRQRVEEARQAANVAIAVNHRRPGVGSMAAAIRGRSGQHAVGSVSLSGLDFHDALDPNSDIPHRLHSVAETISRALALRAD